MVRRCVRRMEIEGKQIMNHLVPDHFRQGGVDQNKTGVAHVYPDDGLAVLVIAKAAFRHDDDERGRAAKSSTSLNLRPRRLEVGRISASLTNARSRYGVVLKSMAVIVCCGFIASAATASQEQYQQVSHG